ncbi:MAG: Fpg/Nei family DNA glycosylase [Candidatus Eisenbacteria bacterium]|nr:Fpg/Nei family DNA glycosylase [Candidatus Eisenbacteria bacterium]
MTVRVGSSGARSSSSGLSEASRLPELPDVQVFREYLDATALHKEVRSVSVSRERDILEGVSRSRLTDELVGASLLETRRHGKYMFARLSPGGWLVLHFGMTGYLEFAEDKDAPEHWRLVLRFGENERLAYVCQRLLGRVSYTDDPADFVEAQGLGPDALSDELDRERFDEDVAGRRGMAKSTLMNQAVIAGIGNIYSDEVLFHARVHPERKLRDLDDGERSKLYREMRRVLRKAIECRAQPDRMPRSWITPCRGKEGECSACGEELKTLKVNGRTAYICPNRQKK